MHAATSYVATEVAAHAQFGGMEVDVGRYVIPTRRETIRIEEPHVLLLVLTALPKLRKLCLPNVAPNDFFDVGKLSFRPANVPYFTSTDAGTYRFVRISMKPLWFKSRTGVGNDWDVKAGFNVRASNAETYLLSLFRECATPGFASSLLTEGLGYAAVAAVANFLTGTRAPPPQGTRGYLSPAQLKRITEYIDVSEGSTPTIAEMARLINVSRRHFTHAFKCSTGQTVHDFVSARRVEKAVILLRDTKLLIKQIAPRLGFASPEIFANAFRRATGITPTMFRNESEAEKS